MIDIIIPAYNAHQTIEKTIISIMAQTIVDKINIMIIDDCSEKGYDYLVDKYSEFVSISLYRHEKNLGVGYARQTALDNLKNPYFAFADSDDVYINNMIFETLLDNMQKNPKWVAIFTDIVAEDFPGVYRTIDDTRFWVFAKIYRTSYVKKMGLSFPPQNANEDNIFNLSLEMSLKDDYIIQHYHQPSYLWHYAPNSITRKNNMEFWFNQDLKGLVDGIYFINKNPNVDSSEFFHTIMTTFFLIYFRYHDNLKYRKDFGWYRDMLNLARTIYKDFLIGKESYLRKEETILKFFRKTAQERQAEFEKVNMFRDFLKLVF
jgi:glycosyltransferase involved in cell wall biosynthesis